MVSTDVVDCDTTLNVEADVGNLRNTLEGAILGLEVGISGPVVGEIFRVCAAGAGGLGRGIENTRCHAGVERVSSNDLVHVGATNDTGVNKGVDSVDDKLGASEAHQLLGSSELSCRQGGSEGLVMHLGRFFVDFGASIDFKAGHKRTLVSLDKERTGDGWPDRTENKSGRMARF